MTTSIATTKKTLSIYWKENITHKGLFFVLNLFWCSGIFIQKLILPLIVARSFDKIVQSYTSHNLVFSNFTGLIVLFVILALIAQGLIDGGLWMLSKLETKVIVRLHTRIFDHLLEQSMQFHNNSFSGALVNQTNRFVNGYVTITDTLVINISQLIVFVIFSSAVLFFYSPILAFTIFIWAIAFIVLNVTLTIRRIPYSRARATADTALTAYLADSVSNVGVIKTFSSERFEHSHYKRRAETRARNGYLYWIRSVKNDAVFGLMMVFVQLLVLVVSIYAVQKNSITLGTLVLAQVYITQIIANFWGLSNITRTVEQNLSDAAEMTEILNIVPEVQDPVSPKQSHIHRGLIELENVRFSFPEDPDNALFENLNLRIKPGEKVGLVGHSGGGKTTVTKLLLRFMDINEGHISIDGQDITSLSQGDLRKYIAYVPQEPLLFHRSLTENISYGRSDATDQEVRAVAKLAHADEFIAGLSHGYDTLVGERGVKLSGGQRQRIAIARAMLKNAPILVLDEATSALDSESEVLIQDAPWKLMEGRTAIVIAHRLSTIQKMDRILVLESGEIIEQGTHKELIRQKGTYAQLWAHQSGGFIEE